MRIERIPVERIKPSPYNPRLDLQKGDPAYEKIRKSIEEFQLVEPLVWNERTGHLVGGNQRFKVLLEQGVTDVDVSVVDLDPVREKALCIALNKAQGSWDIPRLKDVLEELDTGAFDVEITGFDLDEIEILMVEHEVKPRAAKRTICPECGFEWNGAARTK